MTGEYKHSLDSKGRVFIPSKMRDEVGDAVYITVAVDKCLNVYDSTQWTALSKKVAEMPYIQQRKMRPIFSCASKCDVDSQGRILIPNALKEYAGITKNVTIVGCGNRFEIWNSDTWAQFSCNENKPEHIAAVMEELGF